MYKLNVFGRGVMTYNYIYNRTILFFFLPSLLIKVHFVFSFATSPTLSMS